MKYKDVVNDSRTKEHSEKKGGIAVLAYHEGTEKGTGEIARDIHKSADDITTSLYTLKAPPKARFASTRVTPTHSDHLSGIKDYAETAVSIHGHGREGRYYKGSREVDRSKKIYVSGGNSSLSKRIASGLKSNPWLKGYYIETNQEYIPKHLSGSSRYNIVNKFDDQGVQVELPAKLRKSEDHRRYVSDSITKVVNTEAKKYKIKAT